MSDSLAPSYDPSNFESRLYAEWEDAGVFRARGKGQPYVVLLPPPNVTGTLHMGHAFQHTLQDALVRYHRMRGFDALWQMGTDHAGIATEMVVARNLGREGLTRDDLGRAGFIDKVWEWREESGHTIERQMRRLGTSGDWSRSVFTMDATYASAVIESFVRLYEDGLIYRGQRLVNWDPVLKTAISDLEVVNEEEDGHLWSITYPLADGSGSLVVATTRPETMLGDTAVMVHPEDERYAHLIGKTVKLPLTDREIPVIADAYVDREFGTGVVKVTPAHDFNDYLVGQRHDLPMINIFTPDAVTNANVPEQYRDLDRYIARKQVVGDLEAQGLLVEVKPHKLQVPRGDRTGQVIEPYLTDQWFVKMDGLAKRGMELVESGDVKFVPPNWINTYRHWMENIQDWCISRQLWWGHRIPAWYDANGKIYVGRSEDDIRRRHHLRDDVALLQDSDVLETWFSSQLWPIATMGWPSEHRMGDLGLDRYVPSSVLVTGFDIIFFWVARMIMATDHLVKRVPFRDVYITGLVRDKDGQKMSKSKGNILDPIDIIDGIELESLVAKRTTGLMKPETAPKIEKATRKEFPDGIAAHGADPLRFTMASLAGPGRDIKFDMGRAEGYKNFCNKLWNATRFVLMNTEGKVFSGKPAAMTDAEKWILARLENATVQAAAHFASYRFDLLAQSLYEFAWNEFCDWFVELAKPALNGTDAAAADSTRHTLLHVLESLLRLLHPLVPFVTEELWRSVAPRLSIDAATISLQAYPEAGDNAGDFAGAEADVEWLKSMVSALRRIRSELGVSPTKQITLLVQGGGEAECKRMGRFDSQLRFLNRIEKIDVLHGEPPAAAAGLVGEMKLFVPLEGLVDLGAERTRLDKELKRVEGELAKSQNKLASETFVQNAPAAVVEQERQRLADWGAQRDALAAQRARLG
ncbi:valine--tRNA ligase [Lysobacter sp. KIS68-7]|uniref:valine--tRNA ligase n=1 Tax=Lysobacter sp. KIS68-7 TaxID=2904252 RepID=UPI001E31C5D6|nr:valine--tRNA ligase [Lysobacter sp. KIS68-7]UHQ19975.1 valine--tRNA ligase [Lysobacter sp. KIS68-7]